MTEEPVIRNGIFHVGSAAEALGLSFVWVITGPVGLLPSFGPPKTKARVVDP